MGLVSPTSLGLHSVPTFWDPVLPLELRVQETVVSESSLESKGSRR